MTGREHLAELIQLQRQAQQCKNPFSKAAIAEQAVERCVLLLVDLVQRVENLEGRRE